IQHDICRLLEPALQEVHQQERKIVKDVPGGDDVAELDGIEQYRLAVEQDDIAEMEVAVNAAHEPRAASRAQQRRDLLVSCAAFAREGMNVVAGKDARMPPERFDMFVDIGAERRDPGVA